MTNQPDEFLTALRELAAQLEDRADIDNEGRPNVAMSILTEIRFLIAKRRKEAK